MKKFLFDLVSPLRQAKYLFLVMWFLVAFGRPPVNTPLVLKNYLALACGMILFATCRLSDAGLSRFWAGVMLPTLAAPWLCPLLIPGVRPSSVWAQLLDGLFYNRNWRQAALALALLAVPIVIGLLPTRQPKPEDATEPQASPAAHQ